MSRPIYLDFNASTPIAREVYEAMLPFLTESFGNPSSRHSFGRPAKEALEGARAEVAELFACAPAEVVFTSGGTEAINAAIKGAYFASAKPDGHIVTTTVEHPATMETCRFLARLGAEITKVPVDRTGRVDPENIVSALRVNTILVSVMHANNEVGTIQPVEEIARELRGRNILLHVDAAQTAGKIPTRLSELGADLVSVAGHKLYAPKGVGALIVRRGVQIEPLLHGGGHEEGRRAGTESAALAAALGCACRLARGTLERAEAIRARRDRLWNGLVQGLGSRVVLNGHPEHRLPNTLNVSFLGTSGADLLETLPELAATTGSACHDGSMSISPVLRAMGCAPEVARGAVRFSLGTTTTESEIDWVVESLVRVVSAHSGSS